MMQVTLIRIHAVVDGSKNHIGTYQYIVAYVYTALILKMAAEINEDVLPNMYVLSAFSIKGRKHLERLIDRVPRQTRKDIAYLFRAVIRIVQLGRDTHRLIGKQIQHFSRISPSNYCIVLLQVL